MKAKKKPLGMKHRIREERKREERIGLAIIAAILIALVFISGFIINSLLNQPSTSQTVNSTSEPKAAIVDHLGLTCPNQTFIQTATSTLKQAGYTVDYYPGEEVTVEFYKNLPTFEYELIILRVHSTTGGQPVMAFFTSEAYSKQKYVYEQLTDQVGPVSYSLEEESKGTYYFGITQKFVTSSMKGNFQNGVVVMMGCEGLNNTKMAEAFIQRGAKAYIGWQGSVLASHTDLATTHLLQHFLIEKQTLRTAIRETMQDVGADPLCDSLLNYYPLEAGEYTIPNIESNFVSSVIEIQYRAPFEKRKADNLRMRVCTLEPIVFSLFCMF